MYKDVKNSSTLFILVWVLEIPLSEQNFCHLDQVDEYLFMVLFLQEERIISCVSCGKFKHPKAERRPAVQAETDFSPADVFPGVWRADKVPFWGSLPFVL